MKEIKSVAALASRFSMLPGVGRKTALRYAYAVIDMTEDEVEAFRTALKDVKENVRLCSVCGNFTDGDVCDICAARPKKQICVVSYPKDVTAIEKTGAFDGVYHVLHVEGEATAVYLARLIKPIGVKVTRIAQGISMGSELEYADSVTLSQALGRRTAL